MKIIEKLSLWWFWWNFISKFYFLNTLKYNFSFLKYYSYTWCKSYIWIHIFYILYKLDNFPVKYDQYTFRKIRSYEKILKSHEMIVFLAMSHVMSHHVTYGYMNPYIVVKLWIRRIRPDRTRYPKIKL